MPFVNSKREGTQFAYPDVCNTPSQSNSVPVPYPNLAKTAGPASVATTKVRFGAKPVRLSSGPRSQGDEGGVSGGIASGTMMGKARFAVGSNLGSYKVKMEGAPMMRDALLVNAPPNAVCGNPECRFHEHAIPQTRLATLPVATKVAFAARVVCLECYEKLVGDLPKPAPFTQDMSTDSLTGLGVVPSQVKVTVN